MWTRHNPPKKAKYTNKGRGKIKVKDNGPKGQNVLARARNEKPGDTGATVLYRDHVKGHLHYDKRLQRSIDVALPPTLYKTLEFYAGVPDDRVPPVIAVMRRRRSLSSEDWKRQVETRQYCFLAKPGRLSKIYCFVSGRMAFFVKEDWIRNTISQSRDMTSEYAQMLCQDEQRLQDIEWINSFPIPAQGVQSPSEAGTEGS